jgi:Endoribonuclease XendoU
MSPFPRRAALLAITKRKLSWTQYWQHNPSNYYKISSSQKVIDYTLIHCLQSIQLLRNVVCRVTLRNYNTSGRPSLRPTQRDLLRQLLGYLGFVEDTRNVLENNDVPNELRRHPRPEVKPMIDARLVGLASSTTDGFKNELRQYWFMKYARSGNILGSSGFEHTFVGEIVRGAVSGYHNWVQFYFEEKYGNFVYGPYQRTCQVRSRSMYGVRL